MPGAFSFLIFFSASFSPALLGEDLSISFIFICLFTLLLGLSLFDLTKVLLPPPVLAVHIIEEFVTLLQYFVLASCFAAGSFLSSIRKEF